MSETAVDSNGQPPQARQTGSESATAVKFPRFYLVIFYALVSIIFAAVWLGIYQLLNKVIWPNTFVTSHNWTILVGVVFFSLLVGLAQKYLRAPTVIHGGATESMKGSEITLMCLSAATAIFIVLGVKRLIARRAEGQAYHNEACARRFQEAENMIL